MCISRALKTQLHNINVYTHKTHRWVAAKLDEDDPAKMSLSEKMKMFNAKLTHKPPVAGLPRPRDDRVSRTSRRTMPVLASQVQEAMEQNERLTKSLTHEDVPRNTDFQLKMELFRSASAKNTSLEYLMRQNAKFRSLGLIYFFLSLVFFSMSFLAWEVALLGFIGVKLIFVFFFFFLYNYIVAKVSIWFRMLYNSARRCNASQVYIDLNIYSQVF